MKTENIRRKLYDYIRFADDKKVKAIYTMVEDEIEEQADIWNPDFLEELKKRASELEDGKVKGYNWDEVKKRAEQIARSRK